MSWVWWLSGPVVASVLAALWVWLRGRPEPQPTTTEAMDEHREYLDALSRTPKHSSDGQQSSSR